MNATTWAARRDARRVARTSAAADLDIALATATTRRSVTMPNPMNPPLVVTADGRAVDYEPRDVDPRAIDWDSDPRANADPTATPDGWGHLQITVTVDVSDVTEVDAIRTMVEHAVVQITDPRDDDLEEAAIQTANVSADWFVVPNAYRPPTHVRAARPSKAAAVRMGPLDHVADALHAHGIRYDDEPIGIRIPLTGDSYALADEVEPNVVRVGVYDGPDDDRPAFTEGSWSSIVRLIRAAVGR